MKLLQVASALVVVAVILANIGCSPTVETVSASSKPVVQTPAPIQPTQVQPPPSSASSDVTDYVTSGPVVVEDQVDVLAQREGMIARIVADVGAYVRKGDLLAEIDSSQLQADRSAIQANLLAVEANAKNWQAQERVASADLHRAELMAQADLLTKEQLDHARFEHEADTYQATREQENIKHFQAQLKSMDYEIQKSRIVAPFDGVVARRYVRLGQKVANNDRLFWVSATGPLRLKFTVPEQFLRTIHRGESLAITIPYAEHPQQTARILQVSPVVDPASGTVEVIAEVIHPTRDIRPGMTANIRLTRP